MKLNYTLRFEDWEAFTLYVYRTAPAQSRMHKISHFGLPLVYGAFGCFAGFALGEWLIGGSLLGLALAWIVLFPQLLEYRTRKQLQKVERDGSAKMILGDYELELIEGGLSARHQCVQSNFEHSVFEQIVEDGGRAYLMMSPATALVIPLNSSEAEEFVQKCRSTFVEAT